MSATGDFAELAERYCSLIEQAVRADPLRFLARVEEILTQLYASASRLPDVAPETDEPRDREQMTSADWESRFEEVRWLLGPDDRYERRNAVGSIADDLVAVYRALGSGLRAMRSGAPPEDVIGRWRSDFDRQWAPNAEGALFAIRRVLDRLSG